jgi:hypothetical protein
LYHLPLRSYAANKNDPSEGGKAKQLD